jgi:CRISPR-associated endonuclease/helicase Cas3
VPNRLDLIAHTRMIEGRIETQPLAEHLSGVADLAAGFARVFDAAEWGYRAGLWHDLGKSSEAFQEYIRAATVLDPHQLEMRGRVDHSTAGAQHAVHVMKQMGHLIAYPIAGHHSGMLDAIATGGCQSARLKKSVDPASLPEGLVDLPDAIGLPSRIEQLASDRSRSAFTLAFFARMIYSCLVDADFLDTEAFVDPKRSSLRPAFPDDILHSMDLALTDHIDGLPRDESPVSIARHEVYQACLEAAKQAPGLFSLSVPTGGGKTLSSLAFGLRHARSHGKRRVIYAVPFTSIIEQNAAVFRQAMASVAEDLVLEHHCNAEYEPDRDRLSRLATENWDAPLVVTTTVQFYESLFANKPSRCRKLHNIADSVVILDEVQTIPVDLLQPTLQALEQLVHGYGVTVVLCTATQPAVIKRPGFEIGIEGVREIIEDPVALYGSLKRVFVEEVGPLSDDALVDQLGEFEQALCIVNTRAHARGLFERLSDLDGVYHLSAQMCPDHRSSVLHEVRAQLDHGRHCRLISTKLIEAGVDIDFPVVYRSMAGLDSIAQAAGRCNRSGRLPDPGKLYVFSSEHQASESFIAETANVASQVLDLYKDPLDLHAVEHFFRLYYWEQNQRWDQKQIMTLMQVAASSSDALPLLFDFKAIARAFRLIEQTARIVFVPWGDRGHYLCQRLRFGPELPPRELLRELQRFHVGIPERVFLEHLGRDIELVHDRYAVLIDPHTHYHGDTGLNLDQVRGGFLNA